ncbi:MAG: hypothetical protein H0T65_10650 [Deltaproteobacteria bacterium]|nr:hypothetical protein [Deltaproteobacteria bacterium]
MLRLASVVTLVGAAALAWAAPHGKVVRVERNRGIKAVPRLCDIQALAKEGLCVGQPNSGERIALIDQDRGIAVREFRIEQALGAADPFVCSGASPIVFKIKGSLTSGDPDVIADSGRIIGLRNLALDPKVARVMKEQLVPGSQERAELALDVDGNGSVDYMLVRYACDDANNPSPTSDRRFCFDTYLERAGKLVKAHTDNIQICY